MGWEQCSQSNILSRVISQAAQTLWHQPLLRACSTKGSKLSASFLSWTHYHFAELVLSPGIYFLSAFQHLVTAQGYYLTPVRKSLWSNRPIILPGNAIKETQRPCKPFDFILSSVIVRDTLNKGQGRGWSNLLCWQWTPLKPGRHLHT